MEVKTDPRSRFFNEEGDMIPPFKNASWRGCALNRDSFDYTRMPEVLFNAIIRVTNSAELLIAHYAPDSNSPFRIVASWFNFRSHVFAKENWSLEFVLFDETRAWALLADADATILGAAPELASRLDRVLAAHGTSLE